MGPVELIVIAVVALILMTTLSAPIGLIGGAVFGVIVKYFREGKPRGYCFYLAYRSGLFGFLPEGVRPPGLVPRAASGRSRYSAVPGEADDDSLEARHFWSGKKLYR